MAWEPISPELALVDPDLAARARTTLGEPVPRAARPLGPPPTSPVPTQARRHPYPFWARMTAALWLLVLGILIGGAAIPHAQDKPRVVPPSEDVTVCTPGAKSPR
jgi:hypothetical protein